MELIGLLTKYTAEKGSWELAFNPHKVYYTPPEEYYNEHDGAYSGLDKTKDIYILTWYKDTPVGHYTIAANSMGDILSKVRSIIDDADNN